MFARLISAQFVVPVYDVNILLVKCDLSHGWDELLDPLDLVSPLILQIDASNVVSVVIMHMTVRDTDVVVGADLGENVDEYLFVIIVRNFQFFCN